jgi:hypothetical protein
LDRIEAGEVDIGEAPWRFSGEVIVPGVANQFLSVMDQRSPLTAIRSPQRIELAVQDGRLRLRLGEPADRFDLTLKGLFYPALGG